LIKICSRLDFITNYKKLLKSEKKRIATETLEIYIPLIRLFGITKYIKNIEDLCYKNIKPEEYKKTESLLLEKREFLENKIATLKEVIEEIAIEKDVQIELHSRIKSIYSLSKKMNVKKCSIS
jgi:GTP pyrophosphokinase